MDPAKSPRVLFCSNAYPPKFIGGAELIVEKHARALRSQGYEAAVFAGEGQQTFGPRYALRQDEWNDVPVWRVQLGYEDFANTGVNFVNRPVEERFEEVLDAFRPDVVHCHNLIGLSVQLLHLARRRALRTGLTLHDHWMYCPRNTLVTPEGEACDPRRVCSCQKTLCDGQQHEIPIFLRAGMMREIAAEVDFFHFPSNYLRRVYTAWGLPPEKCWVIPNGMELERFQQIPHRPASPPVHLTFVGYLGQHKGVELLAETFAATPENERLHLNIVGDGELRRPLAARVEDLGIADRVTFWNKVPNERMGEVYAQTDCLVLPSLWPENHPVSINEALACGIPVIASNSGGIPELVSHCQTGYLFEQGNPGELQQILSHVARHPDCLAVLSENARRDAQRLSLHRTIRRMLDLYRGQPGSANNANGESAAMLPCDSGVLRKPAGGCEANRSDTPGCVTVACVGDQFDDTALEALRQLESGPLRSRVRLLWSDWLYDSQWDQVDMVWMLGGDRLVPPIVESTGDTPLLLPNNHAQASILTHDRPGFLYRNADDVCAAIESLLGEAQHKETLPLDVSLALCSA